MAGVVTTAGTVFARIMMGNICDLYGPRLGAYSFKAEPASAHRLITLVALSSASSSRCTSIWCKPHLRHWPAGFAGFLSGCSLFVASMSLVDDAAAYICMRLAIGFGLATFVSNQYWTSALFTPSIVGLANAVAGGWGNAGGLPALPAGADLPLRMQTQEAAQGDQTPPAVLPDVLAPTKTRLLQVAE